MIHTCSQLLYSNLSGIKTDVPAAWNVLERAFRILILPRYGSMQWWSDTQCSRY